MRLLRYAFLVLGLAVFGSTACAASMKYQWTLDFGADSVTGSFGGLQDNTSGQSVSAVSINSSTIGGVGSLSVAAAQKNRNFNILNGSIIDGNLKFRKIGAGTPSSPEITFELTWKNGVLKKAYFTTDTGLPGGKVTLDIKDFGASFQVIAVPLPPALLMLAAALGGLFALGRRPRSALAFSGAEQAPQG